MIVASRRRWSAKSNSYDSTNQMGLIDLCFGTWQVVGMPRPPRADEAGGLYQALNRGHSRARMFRKQADYEAFQRILAEGLERYVVPRACCRLGRFPARRIGSSASTNRGPTVSLMQRGSPFGERCWLASTAKRLGMACTLRPRGQPQVRFCDESESSESCPAFYPKRAETVEPRPRR